MVQERKQPKIDPIDKGLDKMDEVQGVAAERIAESLTLDGETHPPRNNIRKELKRLDASRHRRRNSPPESS